MKKIKGSVSENQFNNLTLFELEDEFSFIEKLFNLKKLPKVLMLSGKKGTGKFTLIKHFLNFTFDKDNYDLDKKIINNQTHFYKQYSNNIFPNIIYLSGNNFNNVKVEDIRNLKATILKSSILNRERFIILDDVELFNLNSLNALLKIIEEPTKDNYFILINNKTKPLIDTISSRSLEIKIALNNDKRIKVIESLIKQSNLEVFIDYNIFYLTPGNFIYLNKICEVYSININDNFLSNLKKLLDLYKKEKNISFINMILFLTNKYFYNLCGKKVDLLKNVENKNFVINSINNFVLYNLNQTSLVNAINSKLYYE